MNRQKYWAPHPSPGVYDEVWGTDAHLWGPDVQALGLDDEMEDIELGTRESWWATACLSFYSSEEDNCRAMTSAMVGAVASATSWRGLSFPPEWWPPSAGPSNGTQHEHQRSGGTGSRVFTAQPQGSGAWASPTPQVTTGSSRLGRGC